MKLSPGQLHSLWPLLTKAWAEHCKTTVVMPSDSNAKVAWRRELLRETTGYHSLTKVPRGGGAFADFMARLEVIAKAGIHWQMQAHGSDERTLLHKITSLIDEHQLDYHYTCGVITKALEVETMPDITKLKVPALLTVLDAISSVCRRLKVERVAA